MVDELRVGQLKHSKIALRAERAFLRADLVSSIAGREIVLGGHRAEVSEQNLECDAGSIGVAHLLAARQWCCCWRSRGRNGRRLRLISRLSVGQLANVGPRQIRTDTLV